MAVTLDRMPRQEPFTVTAYLRTGVGLDQPYGLDLAGMVATHLRRLEKADREAVGALVTDPLSDTSFDTVSDMDLPLARCITGRDWHWAATCAIPVDADDTPQTHMFYRSTDDSWSDRAATRPLPYFSPRSGPYRDQMIPSAVTLCPAVIWRGIGNIDMVREAVSPLRFIGRRRSTGEGEVLAWTVEPAHPDDPGRFVHVDGETILRPCPTACAEALAVPYRTGWYAIRPPSWHPDRLNELAMTADDDDDWFD